MSEAKFCSKCGKDPSKEGGFYSHVCPAVTVTAVPNPPTAKFRDSFKKPTPPTEAHLKKKKTAAEALKDYDLNKLLSKMRYPSPGEERTVRGTSSAVLSEGDRARLGHEMKYGEVAKGGVWTDVPERVLQKADFGITTMPGTINTGTKELFGIAAKLVQEGKQREEIEAALEQEFGIDPDEPELIKMIVNSAIDEFREPEFDMKGGKFGYPDLPVGGTGHFRPRREEDEENEEKSDSPVWDTIRKSWKTSNGIVNINGKRIPMLTLLEKAASDYDHTGIDDKLKWASILETAYNAGAFPIGDLTNKANVYVGKRLPALIDMLISGYL